MAGTLPLPCIKAMSGSVPRRRLLWFTLEPIKLQMEISANFASLLTVMKAVIFSGISEAKGPKMTAIGTGLIPIKWATSIMESTKGSERKKINTPPIVKKEAAFERFPENFFPAGCDDKN